MNQISLTKIRDRLKDLVKLGDLTGCFEELNKILADDGEKRRNVLRRQSSFNESIFKTDLVSPVDTAKSKNELIDFFTLIIKDLKPNDLKFDLTEIETSIEYEVLIYCFTKRYEAYWKTTFGKLKIANFRFEKSKSELPSDQDDIIILFDLRGVANHINFEQFIQLPKKMRDFMWFLMEVSVKLRHETLCYGDFNSILFDKFCGPNKNVGKVNNVSLASRLQIGVKNLFEREKYRHKN